MTQIEVKKALKIQTVNQKIKSMIEYIREKDIDISNYDSTNMNSKNVLEFINSMYSTKKTVNLLFSGNDSILRAINSNPTLVAKFYNVYNLECFIPLSDISILLSEKYLRLAPIEWTQKHIFDNNRYYIKKSGKGYTLVEDKTNYFDIPDEYINIFDENMNALENAQKENRLEALVEKLSDATL